MLLRIGWLTASVFQPYRCRHLCFDVDYHNSTKQDKMMSPFKSRRRSHSGTTSDGVPRAIPSSLLRLCVVAILVRQVTPYGLDCSFPIVNRTLHGCDSGLVEQHRQALYREYMDGCYTRHGAFWCDSAEDQRMDMNWRQPQSMVNLTSTGYQKVRAPDALMKILTDFWETNKDFMKAEEWPNTLSVRIYLWWLMASLIL